MFSFCFKAIWIGNLLWLRIVHPLRPDDQYLPHVHQYCIFGASLTDPQSELQTQKDLPSSGLPLKFLPFHHYKSPSLSPKNSSFLLSRFLTPNFSSFAPARSHHISNQHKSKSPSLRPTLRPSIHPSIIHSKHLLPQSQFHFIPGKSLK